MKLGLVLSGGGARGVAHVGVLKALEEWGLNFSAVAGTSAGSIVAALHAHGYYADEIFKIIEQVSIFSSVRPSWSGPGLLTMDGFRELLKKYLPDNSFEKLKKPLTIAATDIRKGEVHYFTSGELIPAIISSCSIPGIFSPVSFNGNVYVDGGIVDNLPAKPLREKYDRLIASHCNPISDAFDPKNMKTVIERSMLMAINANILTSKQFCDVFIEPQGLDRFGAFEIARAKEIFEIGYQYTKNNFNKKTLEAALL